MSQFEINPQPDGRRIDGTFGDFGAYQANQQAMQVAALKGGMQPQQPSQFATLQNQDTFGSRDPQLQAGIQYMQPAPPKMSLDQLQAKSQTMGAMQTGMTTMAGQRSTDNLVNQHFGTSQQPRVAPDSPDELLSNPHFQAIREQNPQLAERVYNHLLPGGDYKADSEAHTKQNIMVREFAVKTISDEIGRGNLYQDGKGQWQQVVTTKDATGMQSVQQVQPANQTTLNLMAKVPQHMLTQFGANAPTQEQVQQAAWRNQPENAGKPMAQQSAEWNQLKQAKSIAAQIRQPNLQYSNSAPTSPSGSSTSTVADSIRNGIPLAVEHAADMTKRVVGNVGRNIGNVGIGISNAVGYGLNVANKVIDPNATDVPSDSYLPMQAVSWPSSGPVFGAK